MEAVEVFSRFAHVVYASVEEGAVVTRMVYQNLGVLDEHAVHFPAFILPCSSTPTKAHRTNTIFQVTSLTFAFTICVIFSSDYARIKFNKI